MDSSFSTAKGGDFCSRIIPKLFDRKTGGKICVIAKLPQSGKARRSFQQRVISSTLSRSRLVPYFWSRIVAGAPFSAASRPYQLVIAMDGRLVFGRQHFQTYFVPPWFLTVSKFFLADFTSCGAVTGFNTAIIATALAPATAPLCAIGVATLMAGGSEEHDAASCWEYWKETGSWWWVMFQVMSPT